MSNQVESPSLALFREHLTSASFLLGEASGKWGIEGTLNQWPRLLLWVASSKKYMQQGRVYLLFDLNNYPAEAPTSTPWNVDTQSALPHSNWPKGAPRVDAVFRPSWNAGRALYAPCDRLAQSGHNPWATAHSKWWWTPDKDITTYLEFVHQLLRDIDDD